MHRPFPSGHRTRPALLLAGWVLFALAGCAPLPIAGPRASQVTVTRVAAIDPGTPFASQPGQEEIALVRAGLRLVGRKGEHERPLDARPAALLAWNPDGTRLAAAFPAGRKTEIRLFAADGSPIAAASIPARASGIGWRSPTGMVILGTTTRTYSFGAPFAARLYFWDGTAPPRSAPLFDRTLKPSTMNTLGGRPAAVLPLAVSPAGDEIAYLSLHDPPAFPPFLALMVRNLESGGERELAMLPLTASPPLFVGDGEQIAWGDGHAETFVRDSWGDGAARRLPVPGRRLSVSPGGEYLLADGHLFRHGEEILRFPPDSRGAFTGDGRLLVARGDTLFSVSGLVEPPPRRLDPDSARRLRLLRKLRSQGLISQKDYRTSRERILTR